MAEVKDKPSDIPTTNALDGIQIDPASGLSVDAYLSFGSSPKAMTDPPQCGDIRTYLVKVECVGESKGVRTDGEMRYTRKLAVLGARVWTPGTTEAPSGGDENQGALFDEDGTPVDEDDEDHVVDAEVVEEGEGEDGETDPLA